MAARFKDIREFKRLLLDHEEQTVARNLVSQLATYATGAPIGFSDRKQVEEILDKTRGSGYGVRDIVHGIVAERSLPKQMTQENQHVEDYRAISRRTMLRGAGVGLALPLLNAMAPPPPARSPPPRHAACSPSATTSAFCPVSSSRQMPGRGYTPSNYLKILQDYRKDFTVFSGVSHPNVDGGHPSDISFLTAAPHPASSSFRNTISLDQYIAERIGNQTRFPSLTLAVNTGARSLSWTGNGVAIPPEQSAAGVFRQMFIQGSPKEVEAKIAELDTGRSILDAVADQVRDLERSVGAADRARLDQYFTSVRELENRLQESKGWERKPKPVVKEPEPQDPSQPRAVHGQGRQHVQPGAPGL